MRQQDVPVHCQNNSKVEGPTATVDFLLKIEIQPLTAGLKTRLRNPSEDPSRTSVTSITKRISRAQNHQEIYTLQGRYRFTFSTVLAIRLAINPTIKLARMFCYNFSYQFNYNSCSNSSYNSIYSFIYKLATI